MIKSHRQAFIKQFSQAKYEALLEDISQQFNYTPTFRIAETPVFLPKILKERLLLACDDIMKVIDLPNFKELTQGAFLDPKWIVPNEDEASTFIQLDFGICLDEQGQVTPKLIELQGFPSIFFYQELIGRMYTKHYSIPSGFSQYLNNLNALEFIELLRTVIVGDTDPKQVVLLEIEPEKQNTAIDFYCTEAMLGIKICCISNIIKRGKSLFYIDDSGNEIQVLKIYNRIIFDELDKRDDLKRGFDFSDELDIEWIGHPNWFFRISKYTMPLFKCEFVPKTFLLDQLTEIPKNLENYVLKPLFSFAGSGVYVNVTKELIDGIANKSNYILQEKVTYAPVVETLDVPAKCEIRMMLLHNKKDNTTKVVNNLLRLSKGEMVGVKYNKDKTWVGGSTGFFEF